jgi:hypothetical protein
MLSISLNPNCGFFSCCNIYAQRVFDYFNSNKKLPIKIDSTNMFYLYKPTSRNADDIKHDYFDTLDALDISYVKDVKITNEDDEDQFSNYQKLNFELVNPFIKKYFTPSSEILSLLAKMERKYNLGSSSYDNICVLFYRGNDKCIETHLPSYEEFIKKAIERKRQNPDIVFLIQSDETEFIETMLHHFPNSLVFKDEIRHMSKRISSVDKEVSREVNHVFSKFYLAITIIMSKCKYIICTTGNCSLWIILFRGHSQGVLQYLSRKKIIYGQLNPCYKEVDECCVGL